MPIQSQTNALSATSLKTLTVEVARQFINRPEQDRYGAIEVEAAKILSEAPRNLAIEIDFWGSSISAAAARQLMRNPSVILRLHGVTTLTDEVACALAENTTSIALNGLTSLSESAAKAFAGKSVVLNGLTTLTPNVAKILAQGDHSLGLDGLTVLPEETAAMLAQHKGMLSLNGVTSLSVKTAAILAKHQGTSLSLWGLRCISKRLATKLALYQGGLELGFLTSLSEKAAQAVLDRDRCSDNYWAGVDRFTSLSEAAVLVLAKDSRKLTFWGTLRLSKKAAQIFAKRFRVEKERQLIKRLTEDNWQTFCLGND